MKKSDWLRSLSERAGFLHPARSETQLPAVKCNCPLWFSRQKLRSGTILKRKNLPKTFEKHSLTSNTGILINLIFTSDKK
jgi:hypothetical protein